MSLPSFRLRLARQAIPALILLLTAVGCAEPALVNVSIDSDSEASWQQLLDLAPVPSQIALGGDGPPVVELISRVGPATLTAEFVLERTWLAPSVQLADLRAEHREEARLVPLESIVLPQRALPVDGVYPDDEAYPYVRERILVVQPPDPTSLPRRAREPLSRWLDELRASATALAAPVRPDPPRIVWIAGVGDIMLERGMTGLLLRDDGLEYVFSDVLPLMRESDLLLGNLEGAVSRRGTPLDKGFTFRFDPIVLGPLARAGFDYLSIVNNHSYDYGQTAFLDSIDHLAASTIGSSGAGRNLAEASRPWEVRVGETDVRVLAAGAYPVERSGFDGARVTVATESAPGVLWAGPRNPNAQLQMFAAMEAAFSQSSFNIVSVHGGAEWATAPAEWQRRLYRELIDRGADLVLGHHSHVVQGLEAHGGGLIAYSLGNFVFPGMFLTEYGEQSLFLRVGVVDGVIRYVEPVPVTIDHQLLRLDRGDALLDRLIASTRALSQER